MICSSQNNPRFSAYSATHGEFDFDNTPLEPPGTKILVHKKSTACAYFTIHAVEGWYIGLYLEQHLCYHCYISTTPPTINAYNVELSPQKIPFPSTNTDDYLLQAEEDIIRIVSSTEIYYPTLIFGPPLLNTYMQVAQILR